MSIARTATPESRQLPATAEITDVVDLLRARSTDLHSDDDLDPLLDRIGNAHCVMIGEASHGTSEFYTWRMRLTRRLIQERGFSFIAVEGDWPDCYEINRFVRRLPDAAAGARETLDTFRRWPTWMWANWEMVHFADWLRDYNTGRPVPEQIGFYGLDVYSLWESLDAVVRYLDRLDPEAAQAARQAVLCFQPYHRSVEEYARAATYVPENCKDEVVALLSVVRSQKAGYERDGREGAFAAEQNALVVRDAEHYYRTMIRGDAASWNIRDRHMSETLARLLDYHGPDAKAIVWAHNTHIGDARATDMQRDGMINIGELAREHYGEHDVVLTGFSTYRGTVIAGTAWDAPMERMIVPLAQAGSHEDLLHRTERPCSLTIFGEPSASDGLLDERGQRAIGVVYNPAWERYGNYVPTVLPLRYDALIYLEETHALHPLHLAAEPSEQPPETFPWAT